MLSLEMFQNRVMLDNPWWKTGRVLDDYTSRRPRIQADSFYEQLCDDSLRRSFVVMGPRRVGKTWLIQHTVSRLMEDGHVAPAHIFYFPIDVPVYHGMGLEELVYEAAKLAHVSPQRDRLYVFFDEVQYLKDWELHLKTVTDGYPNIRFAVSGSAASALRKGSIESGAGRFTDILLGPLSFYEYLDMSGKLGQMGTRPLETMQGMREFPDCEDIDELNRHFLDYVNNGGYPELIVNESVRTNMVQFIQRDIVDKVLLRDLPSLYHVADVRELQRFFSYAAFHTGTVQTYETLSRGIGLSKHLIQSFIDYLESAFLLTKLERVDVNALTLKRAMQFKFYLTNTSLRASMFQPVAKTGDPYLGHVVEAAVSGQLGIGEERRDWRYANWKVGRNQGEVDFVRMNAATQMPETCFEVKWTDGPFEHVNELRDSIRFLDQNGFKQLMVTSKTEFGVKKLGEREFVFVPTALFAYALGKTRFVKQENGFGEIFLFRQK